MSEQQAVYEKLEEIRCGLIDIENEQQKTNALLAELLKELRNLNLTIVSTRMAENYGGSIGSGYACWRCGGWVSSPGPHYCNPIIT